MTAAYEFDNVRYAYGTRVVLDVDTLRIDAGACTALVGPNGAGKTTLFRLLAFLDYPSTGTVRYRGEAVAAARLGTLRRRVGLVSQNPYLLHASVRANIELGLKLRQVPRAERTRQVDAVLAELDLEALARRPAQRLSGGEMQKVALARALVLAPEVLLLDEPFTHLDAAATAEMERVLDRIGAQRGRTVVFSTHDELRAQALADRVLSVVAGRLGPASLVNLYQGSLDPSRHLFDTGRQLIHVADHVRTASRIAIDPAHVVLSAARLESSMRNSFAGRVIALTERGGEVQVTVQAGERFQALITHEALAAQGIAIGTAVWVSFKSNAVQVL